MPTFQPLKLDEGFRWRILGIGVSNAVGNVNSIIGRALICKDLNDQTGIDNFMVQELDGTVNEWGWCKPKLGANDVLVVSIAVCKAGTGFLNIPLYKHITNLAGNKKFVLPVPDFNEFMILPVGASKFSEATKMGVEVYHNLKTYHLKTTNGAALLLFYELGFYELGLRLSKGN
ncbi:hypothetical protein POM88_026141 [Heracleum sosnowskyi]|uniref:phosphopyruvate hydratase n=1 Tax=Heracleum sosnowskyi TaxID=360622 RepID=A0AAD8MNL2_9APIA|nr:hypothetical protein POM88_026141 [Heracleum sosnowskyi]